ncbi:MAG: DNA adenine methylase [Phormidesmis sp. FL-bin-119]|nr:DNA adenine methylase [Pedobacter sp.]
MMAINGVFGEERGGFSYSDSYSRNGHDARVNRWNNLPDRLKLVVKRLKDVRIESKDALKVLRKYLNRPATLVYLDPPYLGKRTNGYNKDANDETYHKKLLTLANTAKCMIFISGYESTLYDLMLTEEDGWQRKTIETTTKGVTGTSFERSEIVWMNKRFTDALENGKVPITLTEKERLQGKLNPERL